MKKLIIITIATTSLSSCGLRFGDYYRYQEIHGEKYYKASDGSLHTGQVSDYEQEKKEDEAGLGDGHNKKVMIDGSKNQAVYNGKVINNWQAHQFTN